MRTLSSAPGFTVSSLASANWENVTPPDIVDIFLTDRAEAEGPFNLPLSPIIDRELPSMGLIDP